MTFILISMLVLLLLLYDFIHGVYRSTKQPHDTLKMKLQKIILNTVNQTFLRSATSFLFLIFREW